MKMRHVSILLLVIAVGTVTINLTRCNAAEEYITVEQAMTAVRAFENSPTLQLVCPKGRQVMNEGPQWKHHSYYDISTPEISSDSKDWSVDASTGEVTFMYSLSGEQQVEEPDAQTKASARATAETYASQKYSGFNLLDFHLYSDEWFTSTWDFMWVRHTNYNAMTVNIVEVSVKPDMSIRMYSGTRAPLPNLQSPPALTPAQAVQAAADNEGLTTTTWHSAPELTATPDGYTYAFQIAGVTEDNVQLDFEVTVNGDTGQVVSKDYHAMRAQPTRNKTTSSKPAVTKGAAKTTATVSKAAESRKAKQKTAATKASSVKTNKKVRSK